MSPVVSAFPQFAVVVHDCAIVPVGLGSFKWIAKGSSENGLESKEQFQITPRLVFEKMSSPVPCSIQQSCTRIAFAPLVKFRLITLPAPLPCATLMPPQLVFPLAFSVIENNVPLELLVIVVTGIVAINHLPQLEVDVLPHDPAELVALKTNVVPFQLVTVPVSTFVRFPVSLTVIASPEYRFSEFPTEVLVTVKDLEPVPNAIVLELRPTILPEP